MNGLRETVWLIVSEPEPRWTPGLKAVLASNPSTGVAFRVLSIRDRPTLASLVEINQPALLLTEIGPENFARSLSWVRRVQRAEAIEVVALLEHRLSDQETADRAVAALREAGALRTLRSTRELAGLPALAQRHAERVAEQFNALAASRASVWRRLPWQPVPASLR